MNDQTAFFCVKRDCPHCGVKISVKFKPFAYGPLIAHCNSCMEESILSHSWKYYPALLIVLFIFNSILFYKRFLNIKHDGFAAVIVIIIGIITYATVPFFSRLKKEV